MSLILILVLVLLLCGGGFYGYRSGGFGSVNPIGIVLIVILLLVIFGGIGLHRHW